MSLRSTIVSVIYETLEFVTPAQFRGVSDTDDTVSIKRALAASLNVEMVGNYTVSGSGTVFAMRAGQRIAGNATVTHNTTTGVTFSIDTVDNVSIEGIKVVGAGKANNTAAAFYVKGANRISLTRCTAESISGWGLKVDPGTYVAPYIDTGSAIDCYAKNCYYGIEATPGTGAEYWTLTRWITSGCRYGTVVEAGNWQFLGGGDVENEDGFVLLSGSNNSHGQCVGRDFSHNTLDNFRSNGATFGWTNIGCHSYANDSTHGYIRLTDTKAINWSGGQIDAPIVADGTTVACIFSGVTLAGTLTTVTGSKAAEIRFDRPRTLTLASSSLATPAPIFVEATRATSTQSVAAGATTLVFNSVVKDIGANYDSATGIFTAPYDCTVDLAAVLTITAASGLTANSYIAIVLNNTTDLGYIAIAALSGTLGVGAGGVKVTLASGDTLRLKSTITATTPVLAITQSRLSITQIT